MSAGHGRRAHRTIKAVLVPAWTEFAGAAQVAQVRRTVTKKGKKTVEVAYLITSDRMAGPGLPAPKTGTPGSAAVVEGHLVAVGVGERESAAERPVGGR